MSHSIELDSSVPPVVVLTLRVSVPLSVASALVGTVAAQDEPTLTDQQLTDLGVREAVAAALAAAATDPAVTT